MTYISNICYYYKFEHRFSSSIRYRYRTHTANELIESLSKDKNVYFYQVTCFNMHLYNEL